jgi:eukaryotic-like serine/threonine-protein kinase
MKPQRSQRIEQIVHDTLELDPRQQSTFLHEACNHDEELEREAQLLLHQYARGELPLEGEMLSQRLKKGPLPIDQLLRTSIAIAMALDQAHRSGEIYGDLTPDHILLNKHGAKLLHFGLAKQTGGAGAPRMLMDTRGGARPTPSESLTEQGMVLGTLQYLAPEQLEGKQADARTDIFALGVIMYEMATGWKAFKGEKQTSLLSAIRTVELPPLTTIPPSVPPELEHVVKGCLAKDPEERWQTAHDLANELRGIAEAYARSMPTKEESQRRKKERTIRVVAAVSLFALGLISGILYFYLYLRQAPVQTGVVRFVLASGNTHFTGAGFAISPDGKQIVIGTGFLWIRPLNSLIGKRLLGTEGVHGMCWSPDGRFIIFANQKKLMRIEVARGGLPETICDVPERGTGVYRSYPIAFGTTCNRAGTVLFACGGKIWKVAIEGETPIQVTMLDNSRRELSHEWPCWLPDGRHFVYTVKCGVPENGGIYVGSLDSRNPKRLVDAESRAQYAWPAYLLYPCNRRLMAQPFDAKSLNITGDPAPIVELFRTIGQTESPYFSVSDTGTLLYYGDNRMDRQLVRVDRDGNKLETIGPPGDYHDIELSPDGKQVALEKQSTKTQTADIWTMDLLDGKMTQITHSVKDWNTRPRWSSDGRQILYCSKFDELHSGGTGSQFYVKPIGNSPDSETLLPIPSQWRHPSDHPSDWSPDGRYFLYHNEENGPALWLLPLFGDYKPIPFLESAMDGRFSPNGRWLAYTTIGRFSSDKLQVEDLDIYVRKLPLSRQRWKISPRTNAVQPLWRNDGTELFYFETNDRLKRTQLMAVKVKAGAGSDATFEAGPPRALFEIPILPGASGKYSYAASSDGHSFYLITFPPRTLQVNGILNWTAALPKK